MAITTPKKRKPRAQFAQRGICFASDYRGVALPGDAVTIPYDHDGAQYVARFALECKAAVSSDTQEYGREHPRHD